MIVRTILSVIVGCAVGAGMVLLSLTAPHPHHKAAHHRPQPTPTIAAIRHHVYARARLTKQGRTLIVGRGWPRHQVVTITQRRGKTTVRTRVKSSARGAFSVYIKHPLASCSSRVPFKLGDTHGDEVTVKGLTDLACY